MIHETVRKPVALATDKSLQPARCSSGCEHHDALTCQAEQEHTTRANAMLCHGPCSCPCHRDERNHQVSEQAWLARVRKPRRKDKAVAK